MKSYICLAIAAGCIGTLTGAVTSIGIVRSTGDFRIDGSTIRGNSTVFDGNLIETAAARSILQIGGSQVTLLPNSSVKVYRDHTVLESGSELMRNGEKNTIEAATLKIESADKGGVVLVAMGGPHTVNVFATSGAAQVRNSAGFLLASLTPGMGLAFTPQAGAAASTQLKGVVEMTGGRYYLTDATTKNRVELRGPDLAKFAGKTVQVTGSVIPGAAAMGGASQVVQVAKIEQLSQQSAKSAGLPGGVAVGAGGAAGAAAAGAAAAGTTVLGVGVTTFVVAVGVVAAGATVGGLYAANGGTFSGL